MEKENDIYRCHAYACYLKDKKELEKSTSGGAFFGLAEEIINRGGIVFGARFINSHEVCHVGVDNMKDLDSLRKSKYVQSRTYNTFVETQENLKRGRWVLYSGTPCQIAGLKSFLGKEYNKLITVDVICHGVPSNKLLQNHIEKLEEKYGTIEKMDFREKKNGWDNPTVSYRTKEGCTYVRVYEDAYFYGFDNFYFIRPSCYLCRFRGLNSGADITLGDYWKIENEHPDFWNNRGMSAVIIKSEKGEKLFASCIDKFVYIESKVEKIANYNVFVVRSLGKKKAYDRFFRYFLSGEKDFFKIYEKMKENICVNNIRIIGSYSSRKVVHLLKSYDEGIRISGQITNSSVCSMMSKPLSISPGEIEIENEYRKNSLLGDLTKNISSFLENNAGNGFLIIDFLEERYPVLTTEDGKVFTESEVVCENAEKLMSMAQKRTLMYDIPLDWWKKCCVELIEQIKKYYKPEQVILNCLYLTENIGHVRPERKFQNVSEIRLINERLTEYYSFFSKHFQGIHMVCVENSDTEFCYEHFEYGCEPMYYNPVRYHEIKDKIIQIMEENE